MQRFFINAADFHENRVISRDKGLTHQLRNVLRISKGEKFIALDGSCFEFLCEIENLDNAVLHAKILEKKMNNCESPLKLVLFQALPKKISLFEFVLQKGTEIGIHKFVPLITNRTERTYLTKTDRLKKIVKEAAEQSGRAIIPGLCDPMKFADAIKLKSESKILLHGGADILLSSQTSVINKFNECFLYIGPEGGFDESEIIDASKHGLSIASLGPRTLRTETAAVAAAGLILL